MPELALPPLSEWETFYVITGSSAAALTGLMFVVVALRTEARVEGAEGGVRAFGSPTVVHFCAVLLVAGILSIPGQTISRGESRRARARRALSLSLVDPQRELAEVVLSDLPVSPGRILERVHPPELDVEWASGDEPVEPLERVGAWLTVVRQERHALGGARRRLDAVRMRDATALPHRCERGVEAPAVSQHERGIQTARREAASRPRHVFSLAVDGHVRAQVPDQLDAIPS